MKPRYYIGIDPGKKTGFAVWDSVDKRFAEIATKTFWITVDEVASSAFLMSYRSASRSMFKIVIEDPSQNRPTFFRPGTTPRQMQKISQNVGANKEHALLLIERFESLGFEVLRVRPSGKTQTKLSADAFKRIAGYKGRTSEHARDAAMLVFGR